MTRTTDAVAPVAEEQIVLVDPHDVEVGIAGKTEVHRHGLMHRAISVLVRDRAGRLLIQRRSAAKYHSAGRWANTCCSHPRPGETTLAAALRRLPEEMGFVCPLAPLFTTHYRATLSNGFIEDEIVHAFGGVHEGEVRPDPAEVSEFAWVRLDELTAARHARPDDYAVWFRHYLDTEHEAITAWLVTPG